MFRCPRYPVVYFFDTVVISSEYVCCSLVFGTLVGVSVFNVMESELRKTSAFLCCL